MFWNYSLHLRVFISQKQFELFRVAIWQCIISTHKKKTKKNLFIFIKLSTICTDEYIFESVFILPCVFVCLLTIIMDISYLNVYYPVLLWQWMILLLCRVACFCCTNVRKCFLMHIWSILHFKSNSILKAYSCCECIYRM